MTKSEILKNVANCKESHKRNAMGCSESWYDSFYAISKTFTQEELNDMSESELNHLVKIADNIAEALY